MNHMKGFHSLSRPAGANDHHGWTHKKGERKKEKSQSQREKRLVLGLISEGEKEGGGERRKSKKPITSENVQPSFFCNSEKKIKLPVILGSPLTTIKFFLSSTHSYCLGIG